MINKFLQKNKKMIKIFMIIFLFCYILKRFKKNYEYFETCQNECEQVCNDLTDPNDCQSACDALSDQFCTFKSDGSSPMNFFCYFNYQENNTTYTIDTDTDNQYGILSCEGGKTMNPLINPKCPVGSLIINQAPDTTYEEYVETDNPIASCPDGNGTANIIYDTPPTCQNDGDSDSIAYRGTEKEVWDQIYYNGDRSLLEYRKPSCVVKNTGFLDLVSTGICAEVNNVDDLLTSDICEGRGAFQESGGVTDDDDTKQTTRAEKCAWIPPTGQYGNIENDYYSCQSTCTEIATTSIEVDRVNCATATGTEVSCLPPQATCVAIDSADTATCAAVSDLSSPSACDDVMRADGSSEEACTYIPSPDIACGLNDSQTECSSGSNDSCIYTSVVDARNACEAVRTEEDNAVQACTYADASTSTAENYILPKCYSFNECPRTYSTTEHDTECEAIFGCNYEKKNTCFENTDTDNIQCEEGYKRKVNPTSTENIANEDLHTHCCEPKINYCTGNLDQINDVICENGFVINDPENDKKPSNQDATTEEIQTQCCISSNILRISVNIKDDDATGGFTISAVNTNRELIENNFKLDIIDIINNKLDFEIDPPFETSELEIVSIDTDLMLNCVKFIFDINRDSLDSTTKDTIKESMKLYFDISQLLENLGQSTLPPTVRVEHSSIGEDTSDEIYGYPSNYVYGGIGIFVCISLCSCCLILLMLLI